jgi:hypothetical protein
VIGEIDALADIVVEFEAHPLATRGRLQPSVHVGVGLDGHQRGVGG